MEEADKTKRNLSFSLYINKYIEKISKIWYNETHWEMNIYL